MSGDEFYPPAPVPAFLVPWSADAARRSEAEWIEGAVVPEMWENENAAAIEAHEAALTEHVALVEAGRPVKDFPDFREFFPALKPQRDGVLKGDKLARWQKDVAAWDEREMAAWKEWLDLHGAAFEAHGRALGERLQKLGSLRDWSRAKYGYRTTWERHQAAMAAAVDEARRVKSDAAWRAHEADLEKARWSDLESRLTRGERLFYTVDTAATNSSFERLELVSIETVDEWAQFKAGQYSQAMTQDEARRRFGDRSLPPWRVVKPERIVAQKAVEYRADQAARRLVNAEQTPAIALTLISVSELLALPDPEWWIDGVLPKGATVVVGGDGGVGKSALIIEMAARLSTGSNFLGHHRVRRARVLYAIGEGAAGYGPRLQAVEREHGLDPGQLQLASEGVSLTSERSMAQVREVVARDKVDVVVFDTLSSLSTLESENDSAEVARLLNAVKSVREANPGCTAIVVHHTNKASGTLRGSSVIRDNADVVLMLKGDPDAFYMSSKAKHGGKMKDGEPIEIHGLSLVPSGNSFVVEHAGIESPTGVESRVDETWAALAERDVVTTAQIAEVIRTVDPAASTSTIKRTITRLASASRIVSEGRGRYRVTKGQIGEGS